MTDNKSVMRIKRIHEALLWLLFLTNLLFVYLFSIFDLKTYVITTSIWLLVHPLLYLIIDVVKLTKDTFYEQRRFSMVCMVFNMILGVLLCTTVFKVESYIYEDYWYLWYTGSALSLIIPMVVCIVLEYKHRNDKPNKSKIVRNR